MPSRESVSDAIRAKTEFATAVRTGIDALMCRCGYSRERATHALLKELSRGPECSNSGSGGSGSSKPTDEEIFDTMRKHRLGIEQANRAIIVSRAMRRELLAARNDGTDGATATVTPVEAIHRLISKMSLDNILYESGDDDIDSDCQEELPPLAIPKINRGVPSSSSINVSSTTTTPSNNNNTTNHTSASTSTGTGTRKNNARSKKITTASPRKQLKTNHGRASRSKNGPVNNNNNNNNNNNTSNNNNNNNNNILVGRKRSIEDIDDSTTANAEVDAKIVANPADGNVNGNGNGSRPPLRASKRLHRSSTTTEPVVDES